MYKSLHIPTYSYSLYLGEAFITGATAGAVVGAALGSVQVPPAILTTVIIFLVCDTISSLHYDIITSSNAPTHRPSRWAWTQAESAPACVWAA